MPMYNMKVNFAEKNYSVLVRGCYSLMVFTLRESPLYPHRMLDKSKYRKLVWAAL